MCYERLYTTIDQNSFTRVQNGKARLKLIKNGWERKEILRENLEMCYKRYSTLYY